jgi:hypothetical protein
VASALISSIEPQLRCSDHEQPLVLPQLGQA